MQCILHIGNGGDREFVDGVQHIARLQSCIGGRRAGENFLDVIAGIDIEQQAEVLRQGIDPDVVPVPGAGAALLVALEFVDLMTVDAGTRRHRQCGT